MSAVALLLIQAAQCKVPLVERPFREKVELAKVLDRVKPGECNRHLRRPLFGAVYKLLLIADKADDHAGDPADEVRLMMMSPESRICDNALEALVRLGGLKMVIKILRDARISRETRDTFVADELHQNKSGLITDRPWVRDELLKAFKDHKLAEYREYFFTALCRNGDPIALKHILPYFNGLDEDWQRNGLCRYLVSFRPESVRDLLTRTFFNCGTDSKARDAIIDLVGKYPDCRESMLNRLMAGFRTKDLAITPPRTIKQMVKIIGRTAAKGDALTSQCLQEIRDRYRGFSSAHPRGELENVGNLRAHIDLYIQ